ncbi:group II intron reverse transcriptase/maturase [Bacillus sp. B15-48]|uniref:group II intron reverse transcriptase/maturase n=1 Tax=Bacillus sp. B15-48 TaxID=1548601 RepID=UPI00193F129E|nr:group II intron reverse transcriptase/maturase [Bacillus sp. B15-48]MBM4761881.1 group II intron reverse transcriptase/maturase [Bacillus sp. B15-48]MBM4762140.1 group II intron reverse transcriptase/maturase [Bacillus sp. B15-48]MBM4762867.1 group II intron reverse transcriptase/maturase [Bacillus sp. B15-48]MBM4763196.1 group II intron reverse transcriptase/maturase [Bacillus sp. B15-48]MBM4763700.1 group II intron reverse transcriptase/maturase [Bacillus sp. B15-48]
MNQELKLKWHSIYGQILFDRKLMAAWEKVKSNNGAGGIDGETIQSYEANENENINQLLAKLRAKEYTPSPVRRQYIPKKNGKMRPLGIPNIEDRIVQQAVVNVIEPKCEEFIFHNWSCGYRPNRGAKRVVQLIMWNVEKGYNYIYDCDIKGFFDNIPHKKLMKVLQKYIADGTVLDLIWKWLKAGYMEEGKFHQTDSGTPQGGVISPLLANLYLNELDWELDLNGIRFVRYADDFLLFAKTKEDIKRAEQITKGKLAELGLEISIEKTKVVDFNHDDFDFLGFTFEHWRNRKKDGKPYFIAKPKESTWDDFRQKIKTKTRKTFTYSKEVWIEKVNPVIRGKVNYFLTLWEAIKANEEYGLKSNCYFNVIGNELKAIDGYIRRRLRVCMIHKHPSQRKGWTMTTKWNIEFFVRIGLVATFQYYYGKQYGYTPESYIDYMKKSQEKKQQKKVQKAKERGREYYTPDRVRKMNYAQRIAKYSM